MKPGATSTNHGVEYCVWAPEVSRVTVNVLPAGVPDIEPRQLDLQKSQEGWHHGVDAEGQAGDAYAYRLDGGRLLPDPASRAQASGVHERSIVIDPNSYAWSDAAWIRPSFRELVIYEIHVGTFTPEGTFLAMTEKLSHLVKLGITAIELMPIADFPGNRNWGYDGVLMYAPARCYGTPDELRALVDVAHAHGIAVLLDVVYNHLGPDGNYLSTYSPHFFGRQHLTPWGDGFNFDGESSPLVREFFLQNPIYWMEEFHIDGFRFDATHEIRDDSSSHILADMAAAIHTRGGYVIAEDARNEAQVVSPEGLGFDGVWADDFHHAVRVCQTGEQFSYFQNFSGGISEVISSLRHGWHYRGQARPSSGLPRGTECGHLPPERFIHTISNHDQTGNRALGERLNHLISPEAYRMLSVLICLTPYTPLLFMGQEWGASSPFLFFTDHHAELGRNITDGRLKEFATFPNYSGQWDLPDPQSPQTFQSSKIHWAEILDPVHQHILQLYRECLHLRRKNAAFRPTNRDSWSVEEVGTNAGKLTFGNGAYVLLFHLKGDTTIALREDYLQTLSSEDIRFGGSGRPSWDPRSRIADFTGPEALLLQKS